MKTRILIIALALVFVSGLAMAKPYKGDVPAPENVSAELCDDVYTIQWETDCGYPGTKFSVVFFTDVTFSLTEACGDFLLTDVIEVEVDFGTSDEMEGLEYADPVCVCDGEPYNCAYTLYIDEEVVDAAIAAAIDDALGECSLVLDGDPEIGAVSVKVKGLNPGKSKGRQNNEFSDPPATVEECIVD